MQGAQTGDYGCQSPDNVSVCLANSRQPKLEILLPEVILVHQVGGGSADVDVMFSECATCTK